MRSSSRNAVGLSLTPSYTVTPGESHGAQAAAVEGVQQFLALGGGETQPTVAGAADDGGDGGRG